MKQLAFSGMQVLNPRIFGYMDELAALKGDKFSLIDLYLHIAEKEILRAFIPENYRMMDVGKIAQLSEAEAFSYCPALQYLSIPSSVQYSAEIFEDYYGKWTEYYNGFYSILGCDNLKTLIVPADFFGTNENYEEFNVLAFLTKHLESLTINSGDMTHDLGWDFMNRNRKTLKHIDLGATESLAEEAFLNFYNLESLILPSTIETIPYMAVAECVKLKSISIPATVTEIEDRAFENCRMLSSVNFAEDGALTRIGNWAFYNNHELTNLVIPEGVTKINGDAFWNCDGLRSVTLPNSLTSIGANAFSACDNLTSIYITKSFPKETLKIFKEYLPKQTKIIRIK
jgi:hypothetical protein